jgi:fatty-acyl-CoA synthase
MSEELLWPRYATPADISDIEAVPLADRGLPESTYALLARAARLWPERIALTVLPEASRWRDSYQRTYADLLAGVHRVANTLRRFGVERGDAVALMSPNCAELIPATLAAQLAGIAAPLNGGLSAEHLGELLRRSGARVLLTAGPELEAGGRARVVREFLVVGVLADGLGHAEAELVHALVALRDVVESGGLDVEVLNASADRIDGQPPRAGDGDGVVAFVDAQETDFQLHAADGLLDVVGQPCVEH